MTIIETILPAALFVLFTVSFVFSLMYGAVTLAEWDYLDRRSLARRFGVAVIGLLITTVCLAVLLAIPYGISS